MAGYADGPSEDAKFSSDFDVVYIGHSCSLLVVDRGNAALREIPLHREDCRQQDGTNSSTGLDYNTMTNVLLASFCLIHTEFLYFFLY